jgi:hypothetical protein
MTTAYERWSILADRQSVGDALTEEENAFLDEYAAVDPVAQAERALFSELDSLDFDTDELRNRALADAAVRAAVEGVAAAVRPAQAERKGARWLVWGVGSVAAAAAGFALYSRSPGPAAPSALSTIEYVTGAVSVAGERVGKGAGVAVGSDVVAIAGPACVAVEPRIHACLASDSKIRLSAAGGHQRRLDLLAGRVAIALDPLPKGERLSVVANGVWSTAVGTAFSVELLADGSVQTIVHEGKVSVGGERGGEIVDSHKIGLAHGVDVRVEPPLPHAKVETPDWVALGKVATREIEGPTAEVASAEIPPAPMAEAPARPSRVTSSGAAPRPRTQPVAEEPAPAAEPADTAASLLARARQALRDQRWADAAASYRKLVDGFPSTPEAHMVLVPLAKLEVDRLGQPTVALRDLDAYLAQGGSLALEARIAKARAYRALGRTSDEAAAIDEVLAAPTGGLEIEQLRERRKQIGR